MSAHHWNWVGLPHDWLLLDGATLVGSWSLAENAFHYYHSSNGSWGYPEPLPDGCPLPPGVE
jgi:hypothetical protein